MLHILFCFSSSHCRVQLEICGYFPRSPAPFLLVKACWMVTERCHDWLRWCSIESCFPKWSHMYFLCSSDHIVYLQQSCFQSFTPKGGVSGAVWSGESLVLSFKRKKRTRKREKEKFHSFVSLSSKLLCSWLVSKKREGGAGKGDVELIRNQWHSIWTLNRWPGVASGSSPSSLLR